MNLKNYEMLSQEDYTYFLAHGCVEHTNVNTFTCNCADATYNGMDQVRQYEASDLDHIGTSPLLN